MQVPYRWLTELVEIPWPPEELAERLTLCGTAAGASRFIEGSFGNIVVGQIVELTPLEGSEHLKTAMVNVGEQVIQVVCGAPNAQKGQKVVTAQVGARLHNGLEIKRVNLKSVDSFGMICSEAELGLSDDHSGVIVLDDEALVGTPIDDYLDLDDYILEFDLTPNRADSLSAIGVARDVAALVNKRVKKPEYKLGESKKKTIDEVKILIDDISACPRYAARLIKGVRIGPSPWWIKMRLLSCGIRPICNIVDITNFVMMEWGHPLHAFDFKCFQRKEVLIRRALLGERFTTLDGKEHNLTPEILLITDGEKAVAAAGVMGGLESEVSSDTSDILLEAAYFNPVVIRRSRMKLGLVSESSNRFEKGADPNIVIEAINRAAYLIQKYAGGEMLAGIVDCYPKKIESLILKLRPTRVNYILGTNLTSERMVDIMDKLGFMVETGIELKVTIPTFRPDIAREVDLIEEIARIEGYDKIPTADRNLGSLFTPEHSDDLFRQSAKETITAQGFDEIYGSGLADPRLLSKIIGEKKQLKILNPIAEDLSVMQGTLLYSLLRAISHNLSHRNLDMRLFEIGKSFIPPNDISGELRNLQEVEEIGIILSGKSDDEWYGRGRPHDFYELKGVIDNLLEANRISAIKYISTGLSAFADGYAFQLMLNNAMIGYAGEVLPSIARAFDIKQPVFAAILNFEELIKNQQPEKLYESLPRFPAAPRDLSIIVDESIKVGDILEAIRKTGGSLLEKVKLFDLYKGSQIGERKKSLAFSITYRSSERSLEGGEVIELHNKISDCLVKRFKAEVREG